MKNIFLIFIIFTFSKLIFIEQRFKGVINFKILIEYISEKLQPEILSKKYGDGLKTYFKYRFSNKF